MSGSRRAFWLAVGGAAIGSGLSLLLLGGTPPIPERAQLRPALSDGVVAPYRQRVDFPDIAAPPATAPVPAEPSAFDRLPTPPPPRAEIPVGRQEPPLPPQTASGWIDDFRSAVCGCATRACVGALQARFLGAISSTEYDEQRDGVRYAEASRQAIRCYAALPENS